MNRPKTKLTHCMAFSFVIHFQLETVVFVWVLVSMTMGDASSDQLDYDSRKALNLALEVNKMRWWFDLVLLHNPFVSSITVCGCNQINSIEIVTRDNFEAESKHGGVSL